MREITIPLTGSTITPVVVFLPLIVINGVTGTFFRALAVTLAVSLFTSLILALTWTPTLSLFLLKAKKGNEAAEGRPETANESTAENEEETARRLMAAEEESLKGFFLKVVNFQERWLRRALEQPRWLAILGVALIVLA